MANTLSVIDMVAREALRIAHEKLTFLGTVDRSYDSSYAKTGAKIGDTLRVRDPNQYVRRKGSRVMDVQDQEESTQNVTVASVLVSGIESDVLQGVTKDVYQNTGTTTEVVGATDLDAVSSARAKLNKQLAPKDGNRCLQLDSVTMGAVVNGASSGALALFNPAADISNCPELRCARHCGTDGWHDVHDCRAV